MAINDDLQADTGRRSSRSRTRKQRTIFCRTCNAYLDFCDEEDVYYYGSGPRPDPVHCMGISAAYTALHWRGRMHHGHRRHPPCPHCRADLGCDKCAGRWLDVICTACTSWPSLDGLLNHGPMLNTPQMIARRGGKRARLLQDYPLSWQRAYRRALANEPDVPLGVISKLENRVLSDAPKSDA